MFLTFAVETFGLGGHVIARAIRDWSNQDGRARKCFGTIRDQIQARDLNWGNVTDQRGAGAAPGCWGGSVSRLRRLRTL